MASALMKMMPEPGTTRAQRAAVPLYSVASPSSRTIWRKQSAVHSNYSKSNMTEENK